MRGVLSDIKYYTFNAKSLDLYPLSFCSVAGAKIICNPYTVDLIHYLRQQTGVWDLNSASTRIENANISLIAEMLGVDVE